MSRLLAVMAHPDDAELWAGGTLADHARKGHDVIIAVHRSDAERNAEAAAGATLLGAELHLFDQLGDLLARLRPEIVITHPLRDIHPEHRAITEAVLAAVPASVIDGGHPQRVYTCGTYNDLTLDGPIRPHTVIDVSATFATKMRALHEHISQPIADHFGPMARTLGRSWGARIGARYAENFIPLPVLGRIPSAPHL